MFCPLQIKRKRECLERECCYRSDTTVFANHFLKIYGNKYFNNVEEWNRGIKNTFEYISMGRNNDSNEGRHNENPFRSLYCACTPGYKLRWICHGELPEGEFDL